KADSYNYAKIVLNFQRVDKAILQDLDKLLRWLATTASLKLNLAPKLDEYWHQDLGSKTSLSQYFERYLLSHLKVPLLLAIDEFSELLNYPQVATEIFPLFRSWHEEAKDSQVWQKLRLVVVNSTENYLPLPINRSPFAIGMSVSLPSLSYEQVQKLALRHQLNLAQADVAQLIWLLAGHPYLTRLALYHLAQDKLSVEELMNNAASNSGIYGKHLQRHLWHLEQHPQLLAAFKLVLGAKAPRELPQAIAFKLKSLGLVKLKDNWAMPSCNLYQRYFSCLREG
ncbi:MAG: hypothetical protein F6K24_53665, partial [Okeania sp. SIO2D1]|nr:hypothetical protein [Okeania sp. SIO2D1]